MVTKTHLFKNALQSRDFCKHRLSGFSFTFGPTKTEVFEYNDVVQQKNIIKLRHYIIALRMLNKACYRISIVLAISCGQAKTIRIRHVWMRLFFLLLENGENNLRF